MPITVSGVSTSSQRKVTASRVARIRAEPDRTCKMLTVPCGDITSATLGPCSSNLTPAKLKTASSRYRVPVDWQQRLALARAGAAVGER